MDITSDNISRFKLLCDMLGMVEEDFTFRHKKGLAKAATVIARIMYDKGASSTEIALLLRRNRTTVSNYLRRVKECREWTGEVAPRFLKDFELCYVNRLTPNSSYEYQTIYTDVVCS